MAHESGKNGGVYSNSLLIEDCEDAWTVDNVTTCNTDADAKVGAASVKNVIPGALGANILLSHEGSLTLDLTTYDMVILWIKSSITAAANDNQILLDDTDACTSAIEFLQLPALTLGVWTQVGLLLATPASDGSIVAVGLKQIAALGARDIFLDDIRAVQEIDGIKSWNLDSVANTLDVTDFDDAGIKTFLPGCTEWSGSFEGYKEGIPLSIGAEVYLVLGETSIAGQAWLGKAIITAAHPTTSHDGIVSYGYDYQGTGSLQAPSI